MADFWATALYPTATAPVPWSLSQIHPIYAGRVHAMIEMDLSLGLAKNWPGTPQPATPAHGIERMTLCFDWSVKGQKLADYGKRVF